MLVCPRLEVALVEFGVWRFFNLPAELFLGLLKLVFVIALELEDACMLCEDESYYTGCAKNLDLRVKQHMKGVEFRYTKLHRPKRIIYTEKFDTIGEAMKRERETKRLSHKREAKTTKSSALVYFYIILFIGESHNFSLCMHEFKPQKTAGPKGIGSGATECIYRTTITVMSLTLVPVGPVKTRSSSFEKNP